MIELGLDADEREAYLEAVSGSHRMRVRAKILDENEQPIGAITTRAVTGGIQIDTSQTVTRSLDVTLLDAKHRLNFDPNGASDFALFSNRFVAIERGTFVPGIGTRGRWVDVPCFWGVISKFSRRGAYARLEAQGKESLMLEPHLATRGFKIPEHLSLEAAVRKVAGRVGEERFNLPDLSGKRLGRARIVEPESELWKVLIGGDEGEHFYTRHRQRRRRRHTQHGHAPPPPGGLVGSSEGFYCFYDGLGRLTVRRENQNISLTFNASNLVSIPELEYDQLVFCNHVLVRGSPARGSRKRPSGQASLPPSHPLSPNRLGRNGAPRYLTRIVDADSLKSNRQCRHRAEKILDLASRQGVSATFDALPRAELEDGDHIAVHYRDSAVILPFVQGTIPLTPGPMTVGANKQIPVA